MVESKIEREQLLEKLGEMKTDGFSYLVKITAVDYAKYLEVIYVLRNLEANSEETVEVDVDPADAWIPTIMGVHKAADWYEREVCEMFGIGVKNRHAKRLLLEKWDGKPAPLRKNFFWNEPYETG